MSHLDVGRAGRHMRRTIHLAAKVAPDGSVSALCFTTPHPIDMRVATWTLVPGFATCQRCKAAARSQQKAVA